MSSIFTGPQELNAKLQEFKEATVKRYNSMVEQNFMTESAGVYDLYKWAPNKVSVFKTAIKDGVPVGTNSKVSQEGPSTEEVNQNDLQSTGQNINQKVQYFNLKGILDDFGVTY